MGPHMYLNGLIDLPILRIKHFLPDMSCKYILNKFKDIG